MIDGIVERALSAGARPLSAGARTIVEDGIRRCYEEAGLPWHGRVVWIPAPAAGLPGADPPSRASPRPLTFRERLRRRPRPPTDAGPDHTRRRIEERIRQPWAAAPWPLCQPDVVPDERSDPLARIRDAIGSTLDRDGVPADRYDGGFDGRLILTALIARLGPLGAPPDEPMLSAFADACGAGPWWPRAERTVVCDPPEVHAERVGDGYRLHRDDGPAVRWPGGIELYRVHGVEVSTELIEGGWNGGAIHRQQNSEVRRVGIERIGWSRYVVEAGWRLVSTAPDPGNAPHSLALYEDPSGREPVRILVMTNGSPDRSGRERRYAEAVPAHLSDPVEAAAWQYGCPVRVYRRLKRRT